MASPLPFTSAGGGPWNGQHAQYQQHSPNFQQQLASHLQQHHRRTIVQTDPQDNGLQPKEMILKVHYAFDAEGKVNYLARHPQIQPVQTLSVDDSSTIGIVDLRSCVFAFTECSPELADQENDFTIYAVDYSEPDTPWVGQGLLSRAFESMRDHIPGQTPKMVTGRVIMNRSGVFGEVCETLEVRLRLSAVPRSNRYARRESLGTYQQQHQQSRPVEAAMTPAGMAEFNMLLQSNPPFAQSQPQMGNQSRVASPALSQATAVHYPTAVGRRDSPGPTGPQQHAPTHEVSRVAPVPVRPDEHRADGAAPMSSRPASRASNRAPRKKAPTGRPRGRPRKNQTEGHTSGYEDGTDREDGPAKKRVKTTVVEKASTNLFSNGPESLRVAASTSGSLRNFRPISVQSDGGSGHNASHLQEVPRAPTPIPEGPRQSLPPRKTALAKLRRESTLGQRPLLPNLSSFAESTQPLSPSQEDGRSPESAGPTPSYSVYSPAEIGSSPPLQRTTQYLQSSPPLSSPVLPPMPAPELPRNANFAADELDDLFGDEATPLTAEPLPTSTTLTRKPTQARNSSGIPIQVFQMQDGPGGQDLVHICSYNSRQADSGPVHGQASQSQAPAEKAPVRNAKKKAKKSATPPGMAPTPPPTTDAVEKSMSPVEALRPGMDGTTGEAVDIGSAAVLGSRAEPSPSQAVETPKTLPQESPKEAEAPAAALTMKAPRQLCRSQSAGPLAFPTVPASEPAGPSPLSQFTASEPETHAPPTAVALKRSASTGRLTLPVPASDPIVSIATASEKMTPLDAAMMTSNDGAPIPSSPPLRSNKNIVKKHAIKQRLEEAILNGEMPPYCSNCGAIETPTWRKIWTQDNDGVPEYCEYSIEPGKVTAIEILRRDADNKPTSHRLIKKSLGHDDDRAKWQELLLCNPCGIWLTKCKSHRPQDRWDKDASRLGQERRKRGTGRSTSRPKKTRAKGDKMLNLTSDAYLPTDALGPIEPSSPKQHEADIPRFGYDGGDGNSGPPGDLERHEGHFNPGSTHSRASNGSGTAKSAVEMEFDEAVGSTMRLLFPSPRKDGVLKTLGELDVNIVQTPDDQRPKGLRHGKENLTTVDMEGVAEDGGDLVAMARRMFPAVRPATPPPNASNGAPKEPFKTPTRPTPSHRPVTRSISRSIRSIRSIRSLASPREHRLPQQTPTKTPQAHFGYGLGLRRSPRNHQGLFEAQEDPLSRTMSQLFPDDAPFGDDQLGFGSLPTLDGNINLMDFAHLISTDGIAPSSPPKDGSLSFESHGSAGAWPWFEDAGNMDLD
ncbi:GATA transcription factor (Ams2) [Moelleriella libera RCEF 2490]|uniref:GATA transcription factor (Ams2) n=1 Tax=Moelleriella libera RCEF 2490 TaxID=1081109 RepID=A0A168CH90_9HYPO|nr:GATA transcription factor (Ams2) [Moelleriella libera RCEF 2490]